MLQFFRNFFKSKFGVAFTIVFLIVIGLAFGIGDVASNRTFGGVAGGDRVATVGKTKISTSDLLQAMSSALENEKQQNPTLTMEGFIAGGGMDRVLEQVIQRAALAEYANAADDATRAKSLAVLQKIMVEQVPMIPTSAGPIGAEYSTKSWVGWPSEEDPYGPPHATLPNALQIVMKLKPAA